MDDKVKKYESIVLYVGGMPIRTLKEKVDELYSRQRYALCQLDTFGNALSFSYFEVETEEEKKARKKARLEDLTQRIEMTERNLQALKNSFKVLTSIP